MLEIIISKIRITDKKDFALQWNCFFIHLSAKKKHLWKKWHSLQKNVTLKISNSLNIKFYDFLFKYDIFYFIF